MATNRKKLNSMCIYDLMMHVGKNMHTCPVVVFGNEIPEKYTASCGVPEDCDQCVRKWLNSECKCERR